MSTPATVTNTAEEQVSKAEEKQQTETASIETKEAAVDPLITAESSTQVDTLKIETKAAAASVEAGAKAAEAKTADASNIETKAEDASGEDGAKVAEAKPVDASKIEIKAEDASGEDGAEAKPADAKPKLRLNNAARKRFKWLLNKGYSREEAAVLAKEPLKGELADQYTADTKETGAQKSKDNNAVKHNLPFTAGPPVKKSKLTVDVPGGIMMAVIPKDYPSKTLTYAQSNEVKAAILKEVVQQKDSETKPRFESCAHVKDGYLRVNCCNGTTRQWLYHIIARLNVPEGIALRLVAEKNALKGDVYTGVFRDSKTEDNDAILEFLKSQNEGLDVSKWKVLNRKEVKQSIELRFSVDPASALVIQNRGNELNYKFNKIQLHKQEKPGGSQAANKNIVRRPGGRLMLAAPTRKPSYKQTQTMTSVQGRLVTQPRPKSDSFGLVWDYVGQKRSFNQVDNSRSSSFSTSSGNNMSNALNAFGSGMLTNNSVGIGMDYNRFGANISFDGSKSFGGSNSSFSGSNAYRGSSSFGGSNSVFEGSNSFGNSGNRGGRVANQSNSNRPFNLSDNLYDQLKLIGSGADNDLRSTRLFGANGASLSTGGGNNGNRNSRRRNKGGNTTSNRSNSLGNRNFFTTSRTGFF